MNKDIKYPLPTVNFNGTDRETLLKDNVRILSAIADLREAINASTFHPRDYYIATYKDVQSPPYQEARDERAKHINKINEFAEYIEQHIEHLVDQNN